MKKFFNILSKILIILILAFLIITVFVTSINSEKVPDLLAYTDNRSAKAFRGNYTWNAFSGVLKEENVEKDNYIYKTETTLLVSTGDRFTISNHQTNLAVRHNFTLENSYFEDSNGITSSVIFEQPTNSYTDTNYAVITAPEKEDTYLFYVNLDYYEKGKVSYGFKVKVSADPVYNLDELVKYKNTSLYDVESIDAIIKLLPYSNNKTNITIQSTDKPTKLIINYSEIDLDRENFIKNITSIFALIPEVDIIEYRAPGVNYTYTRRELEIRYERHLIDYANDKDLWDAEVFLNEKKYDERTTLHNLFSKIILDSLELDSGDSNGSLTINTNTLSENTFYEVDSLTKDLVLANLSSRFANIYDMSYENYKAINQKHSYVEVEDMTPYIKASGDTIIVIDGPSGDSISSGDDEAEFSGDNPLTLHNNEIYVHVIKDKQELHLLYKCYYIQGEWIFTKENAVKLNP